MEKRILSAALLAAGIIFAGSAFGHGGGSPGYPGGDPGNNANSNTNLNFNQAHGGNARANAGAAVLDSGNSRSRSAAQAAQRQSTANANNSALSTAINEPAPYFPVAPAIAAALAASADACMGSSSIAGSGPGLSLGFGTTWTNTNCQRIKSEKADSSKAVMLHSFGFPVAALAMLCQESGVPAAMEAAGRSCPAAPKHARPETTSSTHAYQSPPAPKPVSLTPENEVVAPNGATYARRGDDWILVRGSPAVSPAPRELHYSYVNGAWRPVD